MKGETIFFLHSSSLNVICLYLKKKKKAWIHFRKVLDSLCSRSCIVPFWLKIFFFKGGDKEVEESNVIELDEREKVGRL